MRPSSFGICLALAALASCSSGTSTSPQQGVIHLSADQAAAIAHGFARVASTNPILQSIADSVAVVLQAGAEVTPVRVTTSLTNGPFYAVGIQRVFAFGGVLTTFDVIAFDDPSNPTTFMIIDANSDFQAAPLESVSASFGGNNGSTGVTGFLIQLSGDSVLSWSAASGTASFASRTQGGTCTNVPLPSFGSCVTQPLETAFAITGSSPATDFGTQSGAPTASLATTTVAGVRLTFQPH